MRAAFLIVLALAACRAEPPQPEAMRRPDGTPWSEADRLRAAGLPFHDPTPKAEDARRESPPKPVLMPETVPMPEDSRRERAVEVSAPPAATPQAEDPKRIRPPVLDPGQP